MAAGSARETQCLKRVKPGIARAEHNEVRSTPKQPA